MSVRFRVLAPAGVSEFQFDREKVTIGRGPLNDVVLDDVGVACRHGVFERQSDGRLVWQSSAPFAFLRAGEEIDRAHGDEPGTWELADGDVLHIELELTTISIHVLGSDEEPEAPRPQFLPLAASVDPRLASAQLALADDFSRSPNPTSILRGFEAMLRVLGAGGGEATLVVLSGADEYHNDAWTFSPEAGCGPGPDPTSVLGAAAPEISAQWREQHSLAVLADQALIPIGSGKLDGALVYRPRNLDQETIESLSIAATAVRPFALMFVRQLHAERAQGALEEENRYFRARQRQHYLFKELVCESPSMKGVHERLEEMRNSDTPILFAGEAGTGKELLARQLHHSSDRADQMIMRVNCAEFADESANLELFGSSADDSRAAPRKGVFELARHGTVLLEELDMLPPLVQAKLCRMLKEGEVRRVGDSVGRPVGARLIASIHRDVSDCVVEGRLRRDLYLLLREQTLVMPSLRDRRDDILPLARKFLSVYASRYGRHVDGFTQDAEARMLAHGWPGNVRELQARVEASVLGTSGPRVGVSHLGLS